MNESPPPFVVARPVSRRTFLRRTGMIGIAALAGPQILAACSGPNGSGGVSSDEIGGKLDFLSWEGYDMRDATAAWRQQHNVDLQSGYIGTIDDIPSAVLGPGGAGIDVITYFYGHGLNWLEQGILSEFTASEVPNISNLFPEFQASPWWRTETGGYFGVPFTWLSWPLSYRADLIDAPAKWGDLFEDDFAGKVAWVDDPVAIITTAAIVLGFTPDQMTAEQLDEVKGWLLRLRRNTRAIAPSYGDLLNLLVSGEVVAAVPGWQAFNVWGAEQGAEIDFVNPEDGYGMSLDIYAMPATTDNRATALAWLDLMISPAVQAAMAEELFTGVTNPAALELVGDEVAALYPYDDISSALSDDRLFEIPWRDNADLVVYEDWLRMWNEIQVEA